MARGPLSSKLDAEHALLDAEHALLDAIHAEPDDDALRLVYADALLERGDPRGELISLQCRGPRDATREAELLAAFGAQWLGELAPVVSKFTFERGFLAIAYVTRSDDVRAVVGHPAWSTVRELHGSECVALDPVTRGLRVLFFDELGARELGLAMAWRDLLVDTPRALTELQYLLAVKETWDHDSDLTATPDSGGRWTSVVSDEVIEALAACAALPELRVLVIESESAIEPAGVIRRLVAAPIAARLVTFEVVLGGMGVRLLRSAARAEMTVESSWPPKSATAIGDLIAALPTSVTELRITLPPEFEEHEQVRVATAGLTRLVSCEIS